MDRAARRRAERAAQKGQLPPDEAYMLAELNFGHAIAAAADAFVAAVVGLEVGDVLAGTRSDSLDQAKMIGELGRAKVEVVGDA